MEVERNARYWNAGSLARKVHKRYSPAACSRSMKRPVLYGPGLWLREQRPDNRGALSTRSLRPSPRQTAVSWSPTTKSISLACRPLIHYGLSTEERLPELTFLTQG